MRGIEIVIGNQGSALLYHVSGLFLDHGATLSERLRPVQSLPPPDAAPTSTFTAGAGMNPPEKR